MAVTVDWGTGTGASRTYGIYGIYNKFVCNASIPAAAKFKVQFRVLVESTFDATISVTKNVDAVVEGGVFYANFNPVEAMRDLFFKAVYTDGTENSAPYSYNGIRIRIGEVSSTSASLPPTFLGYDTDDTFYFYNGYEVGNVGNNYREFDWYTPEEVKLPKIKKTLYLFDDDKELLSFPSYLNIYPALGSGVNVFNFIWKFYNSDGDLLSQTTIDLSTIIKFGGIGYWNYEMNTSGLDGVGVSYAIVTVNWVTDGGEELISSEPVRIQRAVCNPKNDNYRLRWINRYGGEEYQNFTLKHDKILQIKRGKKIASTGIKYNATTFDDISNIDDPNLSEYGTSYYTRYTLRTDFLTQEELDGMRELFLNRNVVLMNTLEPVIVEDTNYKILDVKDNLQKVEINIRLANTEPNQL